MVKTGYALLLSELIHAAPAYIVFRHKNMIAQLFAIVDNAGVVQQCALPTYFQLASRKHGAY